MTLAVTLQFTCGCLGLAKLVVLISGFLYRSIVFRVIKIEVINSKHTHVVITGVASLFVSDGFHSVQSRPAAFSAQLKL